MSQALDKENSHPKPPAISGQKRNYPGGTATTFLDNTVADRDPQRVPIDTKHE